jgi:hypothetical protein
MRRLFNHGIFTIQALKLDHRPSSSLIRVVAW